jgi:hypothetical protein
MTDVPTLTSATAANFAVLNPLDKSAAMTLSNGNLTMNYTAGGETRVRGTIQIPSTGKWYFDFTCGASFAGYVGIASASAPLDSTGAQSYGWNETGRFYVNGSFSTTPFPSFTTGDVLGVAVDTTANTILFYKNGVAVPAGAQSISSSFIYFPFALLANGTYNANFGQQPFAYTPPTNFVALNTFNLPTSTIVKGNTVMDATIYTGDGTTPKTRTNAASFQPDLVWIKSRSSAYSHNIFDSVRGAGLARSLQSDNTNSEATNAVNTALYGYLSAFNSNGFSTTNGTGDVWVNQNGGTYVAWQWQAGQGSSGSNTNGSITSTVSVNASAGFSVVTYAGTGAAATVGHGLGVSPSLIIVKNRTNAFSWSVYSASLGNTQYLFLNSTNAAASDVGQWNNTTPTSSVFSIGTSNNTGASATNYVAYCWTPIAGFSAFGSYTGNGSADGTFVYTGFRPKFILIKGSSFVSNWFIEDSARNGYNVNNGVALRPNLSNAEDGTTNYNIDILSNGFKLRSSAADSNTSGATFIYAAFAENPFKNALAR